MIRPLAFLAAAAVLIGAVCYFASYVPSEDLFAGSAREIPVDLTAVPVATVAALKFRHARETSSFDVGLFGSSRILSVSASDVALPACRFFNFALSGESLRASVALIERLTATGKAPRVAVISLDNFENQFFGNPAWPTFAGRWRLAWQDMATGWHRPDVSAADWLRMGWRHLYTQGDAFRMLFERRFVASGLGFWLHGVHGALDPAETSRAHYRTDGSLSYELGGIVEPANLPMPSAPPQFMLGYFRSDLQRLARMDSPEHRIVVYEAPVAPASALRFAHEPTAYAADDRREFLKECRQLGLFCRADPGLFAPEASWRDASHPPPAPLGAYIRGLMSEALPGDKAAVCGNAL